MTLTFGTIFSSEVAMLYNDKAVLENHHVSAAFRVLRDPEFNIVANLKSADYKYVHMYTLLHR